MTLTTFAFDAGPEGAALTTGNVPANQVTLNGGTAVYAAAAAVRGAFGARITNVAGQQAVVRLTLNASNNQLSYSGWHRIPTGTANEYEIVTFRHTSGTVSLIKRTAAGDVEFWRTSAAFQGTLLTNAQATAGAYFRITTVINSTTGAFTVKAYNTGGTQVGSTVTGTATLGSTNPFTHVQVGTGGTAAKTVDVDHVQVDDGSSTEIPLPSNAAPSLSLTGNQNVAAGATVTATATASDSDGSIASYAWTVLSSGSSSTPTLTGASTSTVTFTAPAAGNLVTLQCVVTDNEGATTTATTEVRVPTGADGAPLPLAGTGATWTNVGGAASEGLALSDASDTTYMESPTWSGTASARRFRLQPMTARTALSLVVRDSLSSAGTGTLLARLFEGATQRQQWTLDASTTITDRTLTLTDPGAVTDWGNLWVEFSVAT